MYISHYIVLAIISVQHFKYLCCQMQTHIGKQPNKFEACKFIAFRRHAA